MDRVHLGDKVKDRVTGLTGIVIARTEWMYGCVRCVIQPQQMKDGKPIETTTVDEPQLEIVKAGAVKDVPEWREPVNETPRRAAGPRPEQVARPNAIRR